MYNRLSVVQTSMSSSFKQVLVAASRRRRRARTSDVYCVWHCLQPSRRRRRARTSDVYCVWHCLQPSRRRRRARTSDVYCVWHCLQPSRRRIRARTSDVYCVWHCLQPSRRRRRARTSDVYCVGPYDTVYNHLGGGDEQGHQMCIVYDTVYNHLLHVWPTLVCWSQVISLEMFSLRRLLHAVWSKRTHTPHHADCSYLYYNLS